MRFKERHTNSSIPVINLIPMLNVMLGILAFFVMITMTLSTSQGIDVQLPSDQQAAPLPDSQPPDPLIVQLTADGQILVEDQSISQSALEQQIQQYLAENEDGAVLITPDPQLPYEQVVRFLGDMRDIGGDRVSLALE
ncbi:MAG: ExbD/TolR family protein [Elainellaceae cyanobacterium]